MSEFKDNLDEEMEKRRESDSDDVAADEESEETPKETSSRPFSIASFLIGLVLCFTFITALLGWAWYKSDATKTSLKEKLPSKTAIVETLDDNFNIVNSLTIPEMKDTDTGEMVAEAPDAEPPQADLPKVDKETGQKPFKANQFAFTKKTDKPLLSFVINDLGLSTKKTESIILNFPPEVSLSFSPYSRNLSLLTSTAKKEGHEVWLSLPLETKQYPLNDPGPSTLLINASTQKNQSRLHDLLRSTDGYVGFISQPDHAFNAEDANINPAIKEIFERGLAIIDSSQSLRNFVGALADRHDYPYTQSNLWLDDDLSPSSLKQKIQQVSDYGERNKILS